MDKYRLISETFCEGAVRCLGLSPASLYNIYILSGGQDNVCRQFVEDGGNLAPVGEPLHHDHWVTALASLPAGVSQAHPEGCVVTGCMDGIIRVYSADFSSQLMQLRGHAEKKGVISLAFNCDHSLLFSGSWDGSAIAWDLEKEHHAALVRQFPGHENGVHVLGLADGSLATVSSGEAVNSQPANFKLRLWDVSSGEKKAEIYDHRASIRSIKHTALGFMTTANDGTIALRTADGERIGEVCHPLQDDGSPAIILDCCALAGSDTDFVSVGEDGSCCLWSGLRLVQALPHPCTLWCVAALPNGDFVTGDSNGCIRLFSRRSAEEAGFDDAAVCLLCDKFDAQTAEALETRRKGPGAAEIAQYPQWDDRAKHLGKSDGHYQLFQRDGKGIAAQWSADSCCWVEIGEVTGSEGGGTGGTIDGISYDNVFPVELETPQGLAKMQLGFNTGENPFVAAQRFLDANGLGQHHLSEIADWVTARSREAPGAPTFDLSAGGIACASSSSGSGQPAALVGLPGASSSPFPAPAASSPSNPTLGALPLAIPLTFDEVPSGLSAKLGPKVAQLNASVSHGALSSAQLELVSQLINTLADSSHYHSTSVTAPQLSALVALCAIPEPSACFPGFDLARMLCLHSNAAVSLANEPNVLTSLVARALTLLRTGSACPNPTALTSLRFLCNLFKQPALIMGLKHGVTGAPEGLLESASAQSSSGHKLVRAAVATLCANVAVASCAGTLDVSYLLALPPLVYVLLKKEEESADVVMRGALALGTGALHPTEASRNEFKASAAACNALEVLEELRVKWQLKLGEKLAVFDNCIHSLK